MPATPTAPDVRISKRYTFRVIILLIIVIFSDCRSSSHTQARVDDIESLTRRTLGRNYLIEYNETNDFALCQQNPLTDYLRKKYRYIVIRVSDNAIIHEGIYSMGYAKWHDEDSIEVLSLSKDNTAESNPKKLIHLN